MNGRILALLLVTAACPIAANAQTETLNYVGSLFTQSTISGSPSNGLKNEIPENAGQLTLSSPLGDNLKNVEVTPVSWSFDSTSQFGGLYLNSSNPFAGEPGESTSFSFSTDAGGHLTGWDINVIGGIFASTNSPSFAAFTITNAGDSYSSGFSTPSCNAPPGVPIPCYQISQSNKASGSWSSTVARAPEIDPASAAGGLTLLMGLLAVARGRRAIR